MGGGKWFFRFSCLFPQLRVSYLLVSLSDNFKLLVFSLLLSYSLSLYLSHFYWNSVSYSESNIIKELILSDFYNSPLNRFVLEFHRSPWKPVGRIRFLGYLDFFQTFIRTFKSKYFRFQFLLIKLNQGLKLIDYE